MNFIAPEAFENLYGLLLSYSLNLLTALLLLFGGWVAASWARRSVRRALGAVKAFDDTLKPILANIVHYAIMVIVIIGVLAQFGVQTTSIIAVIGAAGLAIGLALQGTLGNVASSVTILFLRPFEVGDYIDAEGIAGTVKEIGLLATELETFDGVYVMVPNGLIIGRSMKNYSRLPNRRVDVAVGVSYGDNVEHALAVALATLKQDSRVLSDPEPQVMVTALADSSVNINLRCWTRRENYWNLFFDLHKLIKIRLDAAGVSIPFPQRDVHLIQQSSAR
jgi:small conductance mechanosensitive channel